VLPTDTIGPTGKTQKPTEQMGPQAKHKNQPNRWAHRQNTKTNRTDLRERKIQDPKL
jgi:hypothetical protein